MVLVVMLALLAFPGWVDRPWLTTLNRRRPLGFERHGRQAGVM